ncbi:Haem-degrading [Kaistella antarctica]|uniref:Uncharacterized protein n=1 Tax=Kaistella antarctica TaxID=266748 RepID=A0A448NNH8_9FLAO|nr:Haem-degrading [Kaistella antarctica]VEH96609.1 Uncharacterised protein [Kaistella antarctica]
MFFLSSSRCEKSHTLTQNKFTRDIFRYLNTFVLYKSINRDTAVIAKRIKDGSIPEDIRYLDENILIMDGGIPIIIEGKVVGETGVGDFHGSEDVRIAQADLKILN